jgi:hypothetical protein
MPGKPVTIGPFVKGLNNISQAGESDDTEVVDLVNFEVTLDHSLSARPPMQVVTGSLLGNISTEGWLVLGIYRVSTTEWYLIAQKMTSPGNWSLDAYLNADPTSTVINIKTMTSAANKVTGYIQWQQTAYFCVGPGSTIAGFSWVKGGAATNITQMPKGTIMIAHKTRLWICDTTTAAAANTVYFSTINSTGIHPELWDTSATGDNIQVDPGYGGFITCLLPLQNSMIIFKSDATYRFSYPSAPKNGEISRISDYIGTSGQYSALNFENYVYIYHQGKIYELINNIFIQINKLVLFSIDGNNAAVDSSAPTVNMSVVTRRIVVQYNNAIYSFHVDTKTWGQWRSYNGTPGRFIELPTDPASSNPDLYIAASQGLIQNPSTNYITDPTFNDPTYIDSNVGTGFSASANAGVLSFTKTDTTSGNVGIIYLNNSGNTSNWNIFCSAGQRFKLTATMTNSGTGTINARMTYLLASGATVTTDIAVSGTVSATFTVPDQAIQGYLTIQSSTMANGDIVTLTNPAFSRTNDTSPFTLIKCTDRHIVTANTVEYMECSMRTKSYDFQAPSAYKRLFWWGIDGKTTMDIQTKTIPIAKKLPILWGDLERYTHAQLASGTWGNPLSFLGQNLTVLDSDAMANSTTENGRIFAKNIKDLRFRQISFQIFMTCLGNAATGPCKIFTLTTYALPKEKVDAKVN